MTFERGQEVYVLFEGVFALDETVDATTSNWIIVRTSAGLRVELPIEAVAEWDVETPVRPTLRDEGLAVRSSAAAAAASREVSPMPARLLRRA